MAVTLASVRRKRKPEATDGEPPPKDAKIETEALPELEDDDTKADTQEDLRRQISQLSRRLLANWNGPTETTTSDFLRDASSLGVVSDYSKVIGLKIADELCRIATSRAFQGDVLNPFRAVSTARELSLYLRLLVTMGVDLSQLQMPATVDANGAVDDEEFINCAFILAALMAGRRLGIDWCQTLSGGRYTATEYLYWLVFCCNEFGISKQRIHMRIAHVVGERGLFHGDTWGDDEGHSHPLWLLGMDWVLDAFEHDDASPYRYPLSPDTSDDEELVRRVLAVNARRDRYRGVIEAVPMFMGLFEGAASVLWPLVIGYLYSPDLHTALLSHS